MYVSNSEIPGGGGALRFDAHGKVVEAYPILRDTTLNCAGGATPWHTWLSCEEFPLGRVWECDPFGKRAAVVRPALGVFAHEAAAVDGAAKRIYLTEDAPNGRFYRFTPKAVLPSGAYDLSDGVLEVAQVADSTAFPGSEGIAIRDGVVYFTTKYDNRVWAYDVRREAIGVIYDDDRYEEPVLTGVDNVTVTPKGTVLVAEDGGDMQLVAIVPGGLVYPILQVADHIGSEITGPAFDPSGTRLYFSSQRGPGGSSREGMTYEVRGPFATI